ncbi:hypothetical protein AM493_04700 [Flavobacterium akiainvivens]|uniref:Uncharacterized protein n=1 Tax=Flavobacterium akiainvivens TaxID=1202724 RepID=A0A0M8MLW1_9FLAO|nr:hypothetical protein [Flavobacterium akiainvivens]KOS08208.1 hypothetical protein AM493_04700 [Flavobacterium akiainvivens]SFQ73611.1 hypothetical protein SAMN05444144_11911 [Flavobacterium akiainvivens]
MNTITPWGLTAGQDIRASKILATLQFDHYAFTLHNTGDSLWIVANWPTGQRIAFRAAFAMNDNFEIVTLSNNGSSLEIQLRTRLGHYKVSLLFPDLEEPMFRYTTFFTAAADILIPYWPRDIMPLTKDGDVLNASATIHMHQVGTRSGALYFSTTKPRYGSVFYFQNLTDISAFCEATETSLSETVGGNWPELGFQIPHVVNKPLPGGKEYIISDAFVLLSEEIPETATAITQGYLNALSVVYKALPKPEPVYHHWPDTVRRGLHDLCNNKGCWTHSKGVSYLNAYVCDYQTPAELMVQLAVLLPLTEYLEWEGEKNIVSEELRKGLPAFYDDKINTMVRWLPTLVDRLDRSEEQKKEMVMDSWYLHHPLMNLCRLALKKDALAEELLMKSIDYAIKIAHHFNYEWPVFYRMDTLEVIKKETVPGHGGETDVPGSYAHLMLQVWKLTGDKKYFTEAKNAFKKLDSCGFDIFYQANNTAFAAGALLEMFKETNDEFYLNLSYCCIAGIFKNAHIWDCNYGNAVHYPNFFAIFPLNNAPYTAAYEELEVYAAFHHYLLIAGDVNILPSVRMLLSEFMKYALSRLAYYYPSLLPKDIISDIVKTGEVNPNLWMPLEDLQDGWLKSGIVGQEVYGAGLAFGIVPRQYHKVKGEAFLIFSDYPILKFSNRKGKPISVRLGGDAALTCNVRILLKGAPKEIFKAFIGKDELQPKQANKESINYQVPGNAIVSITYARTI